MSVAVILLTSLPLLLVVAYIQYLWKQRHVLAAAKKLPCPKPLPVIGNALLFSGGINKLAKTILSLTNEFKELFCIWIGPVPVFVVSHPTDVQIVLNSSSTLEKDDIYQFLKPFIGNNILISPIAIWKKYRRLINPTLSSESLKNYLPIFNDVSRQLTQIFHENPNNDPRYSILYTAVEATLKTMIGKAVPVEEKPLKAFQYLLNEVGRMFVDRLFKLWLHVDLIFKMLYWRKLEKIWKEQTTLKGMVEEHLRENIENKKVLASSNKNIEPENTFAYITYAYPDDQSEYHKWWHEIAVIMIGATDTVVSALSFFLLTLANYQDIQTRIRQEIYDVIGDAKRDVTLEDIESLTYLTQALMESLRLHGVFPVILRKAANNTKLTTGTLPTGSRILIPLHAMGWDSKTFPEPHKYLPERFSPENVSSRHKYAFIPFSGGPRNCIGKKYGIIFMKTVMVHILRKFEVRSPVRMEDIEYELKVVMFSKHPVQLEFIPIPNCSVN